MSVKPVAWTPGLWTAEMQVSRQGKKLGWIINHANGRIGWSSYATAVPNEGEAAPYPIGGANARLIASAPELAEALQRMVNHGLTHAIGCAQPCDCGARELDTEVRQLLARITPK